MKNYLELMKNILENGEHRTDRTSVGVISIFGHLIRFDLKAGFPAVTTKKLAWKSVVSELLWFIEGSNDERRLCEILHGTRDKSKTTIWTANGNADYWLPKADFEGDLGRVYGKQWRRFNGQTDQLQNVINSITNDPYGRRHIINAWNATDISNGDMALPPCHVMCQFYVSSKGLSCHMYQRSQDVLLGAPFNYASYALLTHMIAQVCNLEVNELIVSTGDTHIYSNHLDAVNEQLGRVPYQLPTLRLTPGIRSIDSFKMSDISLDDYQCHPPIKAKMAV
jgi:thymidylate synthase